MANDLDPAAGGAGTGGAEVYVQRLMDGLQAAGHEVVLVAAPERHGIGRLRDVWDPAVRRRLRRVADELDADVVHVHNFARALSPSALFAGPRGVVHTVHDHHLLEGPSRGAPGNDGVRGLAKRVRALTGRVAVRRRADAVVAVSTHLAADLSAHGFADVEVIGGFVPDPDGPPTPPGDDVVVVGRLAVEKRPELAIRAFAEVAERHPGAVLHLLGDGPGRAVVAALVGELDLNGRVRLHGRVDAAVVQRHLAAARVVVAPSVRESFGLAVTEAMVAGRPVIASDIPAFRDQVTDGVDGWLASDVGGFARALEEALDDPREAARRGETAAATARARATTTAAVDRHLAVYRRAVARRTGEVSRGSGGT